MNYNVISHEWLSKVGKGKPVKVNFRHHGGKVHWTRNDVVIVGNLSQVSVAREYLN